MGSVTYVEPNGTQRRIELCDGETVMFGAVSHGLPGIDADCGGACACATCHIHVADAWLNLLPPKSQVEQDMLGGFASHVTSTSRLSCQITMTESLDGLVVHLLASQH
jgi:ferredoxin, 2Fe-2S